MQNRWTKTIYSQPSRIKEPTISGPDSVEEMNALNAQFYIENKSRPLDEVLIDFRTTYLEIKDAVQAILEDDLTNPQRFSWTQGRPLLDLVAGDTYEHYQEHIKQIQGWLAQSS